MGCISNSTIGEYGFYRRAPDKLKKTNSSSYQQIFYASSEMCGWRRNMEDSSIVLCPIPLQNNISLFAIFDGHAGLEISVYLKENFVKWLLQTPEFCLAEYEESLKKTFLNIDSYLESIEGQTCLYMLRQRLVKEKKLLSNSSQTYSGSTALIILITSQQIYVAHAGDSKAVLLKQKQIIYQTNDHKPDDPEQFERITKNGGSVVSGRIYSNLSVSRGFGDFHYKRNQKPEEKFVSPIPHVKKLPRKQVDLIVMGCDGIWESEEFLEKIQSMMGKEREAMPENKNLEVILEKCMDELLANSKTSACGKDNMTGVLISLKDDFCK